MDLCCKRVICPQSITTTMSSGSRSRLQRPPAVDHDYNVPGSRSRLPCRPAVDPDYHVRPAVDHDKNYSAVDRLIDEHFGAAKRRDDPLYRRPTVPIGESALSVNVGRCYAGRVLVALVANSSSWIGKNRPLIAQFWERGSNENDKTRRAPGFVASCRG